MRLGGGSARFGRALVVGVLVVLILAPAVARADSIPPQAPATEPHDVDGRD
jgi:hypothetical protein